MAGVPGVTANVTPRSTEENELLAQINEVVDVLNSDVSPWEKEQAALNFRVLVNYYHALFHRIPAV